MSVSLNLLRRRLIGVGKCSLSLLLAVATVELPSAGAAVLTWVNFGNGNYNDTNNWFGGDTPGANDFVKFELGWNSPYAVTFPGNPLVISGGGGGGGPGIANYSSSHLRVRDPNLRFSGSTQPMRGLSSYTITSMSENEAHRGIIIGETAGENASLSLTHSGIVCCGGLASLNTKAATIGDAAGASGALNVGVGAFNVTGSDFTQTQLIVGNHGNGTLNVINGADVNVTGFNSRTSLGHYANGSGLVTVNGVGSTWTTANELWVGENGHGKLSVLNGGSLITNGTGGTDSSIIGTFFGSSGEVVINGVGSKWTNSAALRVGNSGNGVLTVENGGSMVNTGGAITEIGGGSGANGFVTVTGPGSTWNSDGYVYVGSTGQASMAVLNGGNATMPAMVIRALNSGQARMLVSGVGSTLNVTTGPLTIGMPEPGFTTGPTSLVINPGAAVNVTHDVDLDTNGLLKLAGGTLTAGSIGSRDLLTGQYEGAFDWTAGTLHAGIVHGSVLNKGGILAPGLAAGRTTIDGNYTQLGSATLAIDIGGVTPESQHDFVYLEGAAALDGHLQLKLMGGFIPDAGQTFTILDSLTGMTGAFDNVTSGARLTTADGLGSFQVNYGAGSAFGANQIVLSNFQASAASDFDHDGDVDGDDLVKWRQGFGAPGSGKDFDADGDSDVDGNDFLSWQRNLGGGSASVATPSIAAVPEPATLMLGCLATLGMAAAARTRKLRS
jgi:T5SS/PEP-CTERM-associated repeat protein